MSQIKITLAKNIQKELETMSAHAGLPLATFLRVIITNYLIKERGAAPKQKPPAKRPGRRPKEKELWEMTAAELDALPGYREHEERERVEQAAIIAALNADIRANPPTEMIGDYLITNKA